MPTPQSMPTTTTPAPSQVHISHTTTTPAPGAYPPVVTEPPIGTTPAPHSLSTAQDVVESTTTTKPPEVKISHTTTTTTTKAPTTSGIT